MAKTPVDYSSKHFIAEYMKQNPTANKEHVKLVLQNVGSVMSNFILEKGTMRLGNGLGTFVIGKFKPCGRFAVDMHQSKLTKKLVYNFNDHTLGFLYRFFWQRKQCYTHDKFMWRFIAARKMKRKLKDILVSTPNSEIIYPEISTLR